MEDELRQSIGMRGIANARELGGYRTTDGRTVRSGRLLRSGKLIGMTPEDRDRLRDVYDLRHIIDMRTTHEVTASPDPAIEGVTFIHLRTLEEESGDSNSIAAVQYTQQNSMEGLMQMINSDNTAASLYVGLLDSEYTCDAYTRFFHHILDMDGGTVLFHCSGGKDRTGIGAIFLLLALGVDRETCLDDFELTNEYTRAKIEGVVDMVRPHIDDPVIHDKIRSIIGVDRSAMACMLDEAERRFGSLHSFIVDGLGITEDEISRLRTYYTE